MRGAAVAWTFGPDSKDANGEPIRPHVTYCDLDRVGYGVSLRTQRGEGLFDLNAQPGLHSLPRTPGSSSSRSGKSPARPSRDSTRTRTVSDFRRRHPAPRQPL